MQILDFFKNDELKIEFYGAKKPKYNKEEQKYMFENDTLVCLNAIDSNKSLFNFYPMIKEKIIELLTDINIKEYSNQDNFEGFIYLNENIALEYEERLNEQLCSIGLIEAESLNLNYLLIKVINTNNDEILIWLKLKSPIKIMNNTFSYQPDTYEVKFTKDGIRIDNYPKVSFDINSISFMMFKNDFYIINKEFFQKYFNLEDYYYHQATLTIDQQPKIISDSEVITKSNAKLVYEHFDNVNMLCTEIENNTISIEKVKETIKQLNINIEIDSEDKFILRKPSDLIDLILLSSGCLGINNLNNEIIKVKKPQYLVNK